MTRVLIQLIPSLALSVFFLGSCSEKVHHPSSPAQSADSTPSIPSDMSRPVPQNLPEPQPAATPSSTPSPAPLAEGWIGMKLKSVNRTDMTISLTGHFTADWTQCTLKEVDGVLEEANWNDLATYTNAALKVPVLKEPDLVCVDMIQSWNGDKGMDGDVDVTLPDNSTRSLFVTRNGETCSTISDPRLSNQLLMTLHTAVRKIDQEGCFRN